MIVSSVSDAYNISVTGFIYDNLCLSMAPGLAIDNTNVTYGVPEHTVGCMLLERCTASGFVLRQKASDGSYNVAYQLSNSSVPKISVFLTQLQTVRNVNALATVTGTLDSTGAIVVDNIQDAAAPIVTVTGYLYDVFCERGLMLDP